MKRSWYKSLVLLVALGGLAAPAWGQDAAAAKRDKLQKLKAEREAARKGGAVTPPPQPTPTPTPLPSPAPSSQSPESPSIQASMAGLLIPHNVLMVGGVVFVVLLGAAFMFGYYIGRGS